MAKSLKAASLSIAVNLGLTFLKLIVALRTGSLGLLAEVLHSFLDLIASVLAYLGIKKAITPPDYDHHYGHYRFENVSALFQVFLILITAIFVGYEAITRILEPHVIKETTLGIVLILFSLVVALYTSIRLHKVAVKERNVALESDAYHFTTDVWSGLAVLIGLVFAQLGFQLGDSLAALFVSVIMFYGSFTLGKKSLLVLTDVAPDVNKMRKIERLLKKDRRVTSFHKLRARQAGGKFFVDVHLRLKRGIKIELAHSISHEVKAKIIKLLPEVEDVHMHLEPEPLKK